MKELKDIGLGDVQSRVENLIKEIEEKAAGGKFLFRGEAEEYNEHGNKITSSLYRVCHDIEYRKKYQVEQFKVEDFQKSLLLCAKEHIKQNVDETSDQEKLAQIQHFGGKTTLIDFSEDLLIALYFACEKSHDKDGRIFLLNKELAENIEIIYPQTFESLGEARDRIEAQKSVFAWHPLSYIDRNLPSVDTVRISKSIKFDILIYLGFPSPKKPYKITAQTVYNDIHGFIQYHENYHKPVMEVLAGMVAGTDEDAIRHYSAAINLNPWFDRTNQSPFSDIPSSVYKARSAFYIKIGDKKKAYADFRKAKILKRVLEAQQEQDPPSSS